MAGSLDSPSQLVRPASRALRPESGCAQQHAAAHTFGGGGLLLARDPVSSPQHLRSLQIDMDEDAPALLNCLTGLTRLQVACKQFPWGLDLPGLQQLEFTQSENAREFVAAPAFHTGLSGLTGLTITPSCPPINRNALTSLSNLRQLAVPPGPEALPRTLLSQLVDVELAHNEDPLGKPSARAPPGSHTPHYP